MNINRVKKKHQTNKNDNKLNTLFTHTDEC